MGAQCKKVMIQGGPLNVKFKCELDRVAKGLCTSHFVEMYGMSVKDFKALSHEEKKALLPRKVPYFDKPVEQQVKASDDDHLKSKAEVIREGQTASVEIDKVIDEVVSFARKEITNRQQRIDKTLSLFVDTLTLDFYKYPDILKKLEDQADENFRTPEQQAMWIIADCVR